MSRRHWRPGVLYAAYSRAIEARQPEGDLGWEEFLQDLGPGEIDPERAEAPACRRRGPRTPGVAPLPGGLRTRR